ncbi:hypothetical protein K488DRAFT_57203 [Vararia minispora EC-137]|uniref:Uncharacterized protein n=1 Tax=Vararia minispora EC-137 TaxID=1314806 RepID=A0ACB8QBK6_9AGAM|nr:hypothetical protein K488DRAFT_57203 [Vararia minispora EC-137]
MLLPSPFIVLFLVPILPALGDATNFTKCWADIQAGNFGQLALDGLRDKYGNPVSSLTDATAISYGLCVKACGNGSEAFSWIDFSSQFSTWLLPWLALVSQLPFGSQMRSEDLTSVFLALGSPMLAAYSLAMTVLNGQWITRRLSGIRYPNVQRAWRVLSNLQQSPLRIEMDLLASLIVLPENDEWWSELERELNYTQTWSASAVSQIAWVVIAYLFTIINSLSDVGGGIGALFLWLLPIGILPLLTRFIVIGWLQLSPRCDYRRVREALDRANAKAYIATPISKAILAAEVTNRRAFSLLNAYKGDAARRDEEASAPIYNYARFLPWVANVEIVASAFEAAAEKAEECKPVDYTSFWVSHRTSRISRENRCGTLGQVNEYVDLGHLMYRPQYRGFDAAFTTRFVVASLLALFLQWGTVGGAIAVAWFTPTIGLGCRSASYLVYVISATFIWAIMISSSFLAYYAASVPKRPSGAPPSARTVGIAAIVLRRVGKLLAALNAIWIVLACMFQFSSFYSRCWCNSDVLSLGSRAYDVISLDGQDESNIKSSWVWGTPGVVTIARMPVLTIGQRISSQLALPRYLNVCHFRDCMQPLLIHTVPSIRLLVH